MELADRVSESVIQIFHNAKGSIGNDIAKWTADLTTQERVKEEDLARTYLQASAQTDDNDTHKIQ